MDLNKLLKDRIYFKVIKFFHENPASIDTARGIATWVGENRREAKRALLKLEKLKILTSHKTSSTIGYSYTTDLKLIKRIGSLLKKYDKED